MENYLSEKQKKILLDLGLSKIQVELYLASLKHGMLSVLELSRITGINRQQIYDEAEGLLELGLYDITNKKRRKYIPANPGRILKVGERRIENTKNVLENASNNLLPFLENLSSDKKNNVRVKYFEGIKKMEEAYWSELEYSNGSEVVALVGLIDNTFDFFPEKFWDKWNQKFFKNGSRGRMIVHDSEVARKFAGKDGERGTETRYLENFSLKANIDIFKDVVLVISFHDKIAIWIESRILADSYRIIFESLWEKTKEY